MYAILHITVNELFGVVDLEKKLVRYDKLDHIKDILTETLGVENKGNKVPVLACKFLTRRVILLVCFFLLIFFYFFYDRKRMVRTISF